MRKPIKVLIIDDSAVVRQILTEILSSDKEIEVIGTAIDPYIARDKIKKLNPDVLTLDVEMPRMDGISFLRNLMRLRPMPVIMISSLTEEGADIALEALGLGAVDYVSKPKIDVKNQLGSYSEEIISKVKAAASANIIPGIAAAIPATHAKVPPKVDSDKTVSKKPYRKVIKTTEKIIAIGASTGGTEAIKEILMGMRPDSPGTLITQHIPASFSAAFAKRMNTVSPMSVCEAIDGQQVLPGHAYIAPGDKHLLLERSGARYYCRLDDGELRNRHKPSVEVLFESVEEAAGVNAIGIILTGMGADGARALMGMREAGARTIAQDENSSVVWGMPGEAVKMGAAEYVLPLSQIADKVETLLSEQ